MTNTALVPGYVTARPAFISGRPKIYWAGARPKTVPPCSYTCRTFQQFQETTVYLDISNDGKCQCSLMALTGEVSKLSAPDIGSLTNSIDTVMHGENWRYDLTSRDKQFLAFWKLGISATGAEYFQILAPSVDLADDKYQLRPSDDLEKLSVRANRGQRALLGIMLSFYHSERGQRYLKKMRCPNICDLSWSLDSFHREIAAGLFRNYAGW